jgi:hypothetical protein
MVNDAPPSFDSLMSLQSEVTDSVIGAVTYIASIDKALRVIDVLLNRLQPMKAGRISVKFVLRNGIVVPEPRIFRPIRTSDRKVRWISSYTNHKWLSRKVRSAREFEANHETVRNICTLVTTLLDLRKQMVKRVRDAEMAFANTISSRAPTVTEMGKQLMTMLDQIGSADPTVYAELRLAKLEEADDEDDDDTSD